MKNDFHPTLYLLFFFLSISNLFAQQGYFDAPYKRYEADLATLNNGAFVTTKSFAQVDLQSEASDQQCVNMSTENASVEWTIPETADGLVLRYSVPNGQTATVAIFNGITLITTLTLTSTWSWESLYNNGNPNNGGITNLNPKMRFDEVRYKLPTPIPALGTLKIVRQSGNVHLDFAELESVPPANIAPIGAVTYTGNGSNLQTFINSNGGQKIFIPTGVYNVNTSLYLGVSNTSLVGAGMWYTQINFTNTTANNGGLVANATNIDFSDLYLTTNSTSRSNSYKAINGVFTAASTITNIWAEHFECGAWIAQYNTGGPAIADCFILSNCRFRNNYADGINLCKGTSNAIVEHCNFRNNGDDDQAIWCANGQECINNTFRYNTSELCWRASGVAFYGGKNNKAHHLIIKDNLESGIRISNNFPGVGFNALGLNELYEITISNCGTFNDLYNQPVGAIDIFSANTAGTQVKNLKFSAISILNAKNDAVLIQKKSGDGIYNLSFENITINGTGKEFPNNNIANASTLRGYFFNFKNAPNGNATFCNMTYTNRGGNATTDQNTSDIGTFAWTQVPICNPLSIEEMKVDAPILFPNPVKNELTLTHLKPNTTIAVLDMMGKIVLIKTTLTDTEKIDTTDFANGIYIIQMKDEERRMTSKFVKN